MKHIPTVIQEIQSMEIDVEEILYLVQELARRHELEPAGKLDAYTVGSIILAEKYRNQPGRAFCVLERMNALVSLQGDSRMKGWTIQGTEEGCLLTSEAIFRAVARCPLRADSKRVWFDAEEFFNMALRETPSEGTA